MDQGHESGCKAIGALFMNLGRCTHVTAFTNTLQSEVSMTYLIQIRQRVKLLNYA